MARNELGLHSNPLFIKYLGFVYSEKASRKPELQYRMDRALLDSLRISGVWSYTFHPNFVNWLSFYWKGFRQTTRYTYRIPLDPSTNFRRNYGEKVKSALRAAHRHQLEPCPINLDEFIQVNRLTYTARRTQPPYNEPNLRRRLECLMQRGMFVPLAVCDSARKIHAVAGLAHDRRCAYLILNGSDPELRHSGGNTLVVDHAIEWANQHCANFDFEGSMIHRIERFYRGFGAQLTPFHHIQATNVATSAYLTALKLYKRIRYS